jgi:hypothetical protein
MSRNRFQPTATDSNPVELQLVGNWLQLVIQPVQPVGHGSVGGCSIFGKKNNQLRSGCTQKGKKTGLDWTFKH